MIGTVRAVAMVVTALSASSRAASVPPASPATLEAVREARLSGDGDRAITLAREILANRKKRGDHPAAGLALGRIYYDAGRYDEAAHVLARATTGPLADMALFYRAESLFWAGEPRLARNLLERLLDKYPRSPWLDRARLRRADCILAERRYAPAVIAYRDLLEHYPRHPRRHAIVVALAQALEGKGERANAATTYRTVWVRWPESPSAKVAEAELVRLEKAGFPRPPTDGERIARARSLRYLRVHDLNDTELRAFEEAVADRADIGEEGAVNLLWRVRFERALNLLEARKRKPAVAILEVLKTDAPEGLEPRVEYTFANALARIGRIDVAAARVEEVITEAKTGVAANRAHFRAALFYITYARYEEALKHLSPLMKTTRPGSDVAWRWAWTNMRAGRLEVAAAAMKSFCEARRGDRERCPYWQARIAERLGKRAEAMAGYRGLATRAPLSYYAILSRSRLVAAGELPPLISTSVDPAALELEGEGAPDADDGDLEPGDDLDPGAVDDERHLEELEASDHATDVAGSGLLSGSTVKVKRSLPKDRLVTSDLRTVRGIVEDAAFEEVDLHFGAEEVSPDPDEDALFADAVKRYGRAIPALGRVRTLWQIGELGIARDELGRVFRAYASTRGWKTPISVARWGWTDERVAIAGSGALLWSPTPTATAASVETPAASSDSPGDSPGDSPDDSTGDSPDDSAGDSDGTATAAGSAVVAPPSSLPTVWLGGLDARFHDALGHLFVAVGDVHYSRKLLGPMEDATAEMKLMRYYPRAFPERVRAAAKKRGLDPAILWAVMHTESNFHPYVTSRAGARGLMQVMPRTGKLIARALKRTGFDVDELFDPDTSIEFGAWYLREVLDKFHGQLAVALAAYNGGPRNIERWIDAKAHSAPEMDEFIEEIPFDESRGYAKKVLAKVGIYRYLYSGARTFDVKCALDTICEPNIDF